jgi:hypothetical protein
MLSDFLRGHLLVRFAISLGVLFGFGVLGLIYLAKTLTMNQATGPNAVPNAGLPPGTNTGLPPVPDDAPQFVLDAIRVNAKRPDAKVELIHWWPPKYNGFHKSGAPVCRIQYRLDGDPAGTTRDGAYEVVNDHATPLYDQVEGEESHRTLDPYFECKECRFGIDPAAKPPAPPAWTPPKRRK